MANYDILCFLEYYADRTSVVDGSGNRTPTRQWQNFYQHPQTLSIDANATGKYGYLAFDITGFGSTEAGSIHHTGAVGVILQKTKDVVISHQLSPNAARVLPSRRIRSSV
jgi:hypothetical protein